MIASPMYTRRRCFIVWCVVQIVSTEGAEHPFAVSVWGGWVVWSDWMGRGVLRADKLAGHPRTLLAADSRPMAVIIVAPDQHTCESV